jgi:hypothetical protein
VAGRSFAAVWASALALALAAGCDRGLGVPAGDAQAVGEQSAEAPLLAKMAAAPTQVTYSGTRIYLAPGAGAQGQTLELREDVIADGAGQFAVSPLELLQPPLSPADAALFFLTQKLRERMMYFVRDFGVRDLDLFAANYALVDTAQATQVAGVTCQRMLVARRQNPERRYVLDVDTVTGLVLSVREEALDGTLLSSLAYETIDYTPDLANVSWNVPVNQEEELVQGTPEALVSLGFLPRTPKVLPSGWQQIGLAKLVDPTNDQVWARVTYSDGVEHIFFTVAKGDGPSHQLKNPPPGTNPSHADRVKKMAIGTWTLLEADLSLGRVLVLGRAPDGVLEDMIQSAFF